MMKARAAGGKPLYDECQDIVNKKMCQDIVNKRFLKI